MHPNSFPFDKKEERGQEVCTACTSARACAGVIASLLQSVRDRRQPKVPARVLARLWYDLWSVPKRVTPLELRVTPLTALGERVQVVMAI